MRIPMQQTLQDHLNALPAGQVLRIAGATDFVVTAPYVEDTRMLERGGIFVARKGLNVDGHEYINKAIELGASAVIGEYAIDLDIPYVQLKDAQLSLGYLCAAYYGFPSRKLTVLGITGTNGKTTTTHM